ncbi:microtubule nucleation factor SSNA1 isoform X1 [Rissa tridactyla]|uniref:microtubule nucleation factor SSNA1 isoform X1 n=1 Tax=Rissa tridactyla TaxID=75485 RepID=UPI0023BA74B1|nr:microtubule nucleation factor SSNA1 isoform X1 [Rissa tridactyla]
MSGPGPALRGYNAELQEALAELRARREELSGRIREEEAERGRLQGRLWALTQRLARTSESLARNLAARGELDRTIAETEAAYGKVTPARVPPRRGDPGPEHLHSGVTPSGPPHGRMTPDGAARGSGHPAQAAPANGRPGFGLGESTLSKHTKKTYNSRWKKRRKAEPRR